MHIVIVEDDQFENEITALDIAKRYPQAKITSTRSVGEFLLKVDGLRSADVVVMNHYLPLGELLGSEEETDNWFNNLGRKFPDMVVAWNHREGGERLLRWMRQNGMQMPVLFHTHSDIKSISDDVRADPAFFHTEKSSDGRGLGSSIEHALQAK
jgi:hypothetical protein